MVCDSDSVESASFSPVKKKNDGDDTVSRSQEYLPIVVVGACASGRILQLSCDSTL